MNTKGEELSNRYSATERWMRDDPQWKGLVWGGGGRNEEGTSRGSPSIYTSNKNVASEKLTDNSLKLKKLRVIDDAT